MAKRIIRLTESDLHRIIKESVIRTLNEAEKDGKSSKKAVKDMFNDYEEFEDWRKQYDDYMDHILDRDKAEGEAARLRYIAAINRDFGGDPSSKSFTGDKKAFKKAYDKHSRYRDTHDKHISPQARRDRHQMDLDYDEKYGFNPDDEAAGGVVSGEEPVKKRARRGSLMTKVKPDASFLKKEEPKSKFSGLSPEELEAKMKEMGFAK